MPSTARRPVWISLVVSLLALTAAAESAAQTVPVLVSTDWLAEHLDDADVRVLYVAMAQRRSPTEFIPGSGLIDYHALAASRRNGLIIEMQPVEEMVRALRDAGISTDTHVVLYGHPQHLPARAFVVLEYLGHARVSVLDGGLRVWTGEGRETVPTPTRTAAGRFAAQPRDDVLVDRDWIRERLEDPRVALVDARPADEFSGARASGNTVGGHIPGARNIYWEDLLASESMPRLMDLHAVRERYEAAGATADGIVVSYCYIGMRASYTYLIARHLGYETRFYDGSWNDWSQAGLPAETGR